MADEDLKRNLMNKFSQEEIDTYVNMVAILAEKTVIGLLMDMIDEQLSNRSLSNEQAEMLISGLKAIQKHQSCGYVKISFEIERVNYDLCASLTLVDKNYKPDVNVPNEQIARDLISNYDNLKGSAQGYWKGFLEKHPEYVDRLRSSLPFINFDELVVGSDNNTTLYFDKDSRKRVGLYSYYNVDKKLYYKK